MQVPPQFHEIARTVMQDIEDLRRGRNASVDIAPLFPRLLRNVSLLVAAVDGHLNREAAAIRPPNLTRGLPENDVSRMRLT